MLIGLVAVLCAACLDAEQPEELGLQSEAPPSNAAVSEIDGFDYEYGAVYLAGTTDIYMKYDGDDSNDGLTTSTPVRTLDRVKTIADGIEDTNIEVQIHPGTYNDDSVVWDNDIVADQIITFRQWEGQSGWPLFIGPGLGPTSAYNKSFFVLPSSSSTGIATNLRFWHLKIQYYKDGIVLNGQMDDEDGYNEGNQIMDVRFWRLGDKWAGDGNKPGYKCLGLTNSRNNVVRYSRFDNCANAGGDPNEALMHGIYLAFFASDNDIKFNFFGNNSGDAIKVRDQSGDNFVWGNAFWKSGASAATVGDWYQNPNKVSKYRTQANWDTHGERWECPSFTNNVRYNDYGKDYDNAAALPQVATVRPEDDPDYTGAAFQPDWVFDCPGPGGLNRFTTAGNDYTANWSTIDGIIDGWEDTGGIITSWRNANNIL